MANITRDLYAILLLIAVLYTSAYAEEEVEDETQSTDRNSLTSLRLPTDMSLPANMLQLVTAAGALVLGFVGVAVVASLILPLFGVRLCHIVGTCDHLSTAAYSGTGVGHNYDAYSTAGTFNQPSSLTYGTGNFQRRSLEYVGPILKALSAAYDKYAVPLIKKKE